MAADSSSPALKRETEMALSSWHQFWRGRPVKGELRLALAGEMGPRSSTQGRSSELMRHPGFMSERFTEPMKFIQMA